MTNLNNLESNHSVNTDFLQKYLSCINNLQKELLIMSMEYDFMNHNVSPATEYYDDEDNQISDLVSLRTVMQALDNLGIEVGVRELVYAIDEIEDDFPFEYLRENEESSYEH